MKKLILTPASPGITTSAGSVYTAASLREGLPSLALKTAVILALLFLLSTQCTSAQKMDTSVSVPPQTSYNFYMQKHKTNNTIGWLLLAPGVTMTAVGLAIGADNVKNIFASDYDSHKGEAIAVTGGVMALLSIPFFISARSDKRKALLSLKIKKEKLSIGERGPGKFTYPAIALKIKF